MNKIKIELGEKVVVFPHRFGRKSTEDGTPLHYAAEITKIGRKYFTVTTLDEYKFEYIFYKDTLEEKNSHNYSSRVYSSLEDYLTEVANKKATKKLKNQYFDGWRLPTLTVDQVDRIIAILEEK